MMTTQMNGPRRSLSRALAKQEGMTLIEIMIVVIIMAMIATGVAVAVMPQLDKAKIKQAKTDIGAIRTAVQLYLAENSNKCPSVQDLQEERYLDKGKRSTDPWDREFIITCTAGEDPDVYSPGPDGQDGTEDDIR